MIEKDEDVSKRNIYNTAYISIGKNRVKNNRKKNILYISGIKRRYHVWKYKNYL